MTTPTLGDDDHVLAGEYVLGTLPHDERRRVEQRLAHEPALQKAVEAWEMRFHPYSALAEPVAPSDYLWARIQRSLAQKTPATQAVKSAAQQASTAPTPMPKRARKGVWHSLPAWRAAAGLGMAAALVMGILLINPSSVPVTPQYMVVLMAPQTDSAGWVVQASTRQEIELIPLGTFEVPEGKALEFWTKADDWQAPVSLGLIEPGGPIRLRLDELPPLEDDQLFELTLEDATGSPTGLPTGPIEFIGRAVEI